MGAGFQMLMAWTDRKVLLAASVMNHPPAAPSSGALVGFVRGTMTGTGVVDQPVVMVTPGVDLSTWTTLNPGSLSLGSKKRHNRMPP